MFFPSFGRKMIPGILCGLLLAGTGALRADGGSMSQQAHNELLQAETSTGADQQAHLKAALQLINHLPAGGSRGRKKAKQDTESALFESQRGDPEHLAAGYIRDAETVLDKMKQ